MIETSPNNVDNVDDMYASNVDDTYASNVDDMYASNVDDMYVSKRYVPYIILSIIILSFFLRVYYLEKESVWYDEAASVYQSENSILTIVNIFERDPSRTLYYAILHFWIEIFGNGAFSIRFPSVIFGTLSIYVIYKLGELIFDTNVGILSSLIMSISVYHIRYSQEARAYTLLVLLVLLSNYYFIKISRDKGKHKDKDEETRIERRYKIGYIISSIMATYTHGYGIFYFISQNVYTIFKKRYMKLLMVNGVIISSFLLWIPFLLSKNDEILKDNEFGLKVPTYDSVYNTFNIFVGGEKMLYIYITIIIIGISICLYRGYKNKSATYICGNDSYIDKYIFIVLWIIVPIIMGYIVSYEVAPLYHNRYIIASLPALILLFSNGLYEISNIPSILSKTKMSHMILSAYVALSILLILIFQIPLIEKYYQDTKKDQWKEVVDEIENVGKDGDVILLYPEFTKIAFDYYLKKNFVTIGINSSFDTSSIDEERIWLIYSHMGYKERKIELEDIENKLSMYYSKNGTIAFYGIKIEELDKSS